MSSMKMMTTFGGRVAWRPTAGEQEQQGRPGRRGSLEV
jgi:hypothetical protein